MPYYQKIPYQQANLSPDIEVLKHADTKMMLHSEIGLLGLPGRSRSLPLPCPTRCSCCCHRSTSLPGARRGMLRWVRLCWDSWFSLRWTVLAFEQQANIEWTGFVLIFVKSQLFHQPENCGLQSFWGRMMLLDSGPTLPSINQSCYNATTNKHGRGRRRPKWTLSKVWKWLRLSNLMDPLLKKRSSACCPTPIGSGIQ